MQNDKKSGRTPKMLTLNAAFTRGLIAFGVILCSILVFFFFYKFETVSNIVSSFFSYISAIIYGLAIAYLLNPLVKRFQKLFDKLFTAKCKTEKKGLRISKGISISLSIMIFIAAIIILIVMIIPGLVTSITTLIDVLPPKIDQLNAWFNDKTNEKFATYISDVTLWLEKELLPSAAKYITAGVSSTVASILNFIIGIVVAVYALCDKEKFVGQTKKLLYALFKPKTVGRILDTARHTDRIFGGFLSGKIIDSIIVGIITFISLTIMKTPYTLLVSVIVGVTNIIPFFGPFIGAIPSALLIFLSSPIKGLYFVLFIIVLQQIDGNIIGPKILGSTTGISEFWVTFALLLFGGWFGFVGMIIGVPLFAALWYILSAIVNNHLKDKNMPVDSSAYLDIDEQKIGEPGDGQVSENSD